MRRSANTWVHGSALLWRSGVYTNQSATASGPDVVNLFGAWRGRPCDVAGAFGASSVWSDIEDPSWLFNYWQNWPGRMSFAIPLPPSSPGGLTLAAGAS